MIEEIAQAVKDLGLGNIESVGNFENRLTAQVERGDMADGNAQSIGDRLRNIQFCDIRSNIFPVRPFCSAARTAA